MSSLPFRINGAGPGLFRAVSIVTLVTMLFGGFVAMPSAARAASTQTTDDLNLRAQPALNAAILDVMVAGESVETTGEPVNGFYPVLFEGVAGFAYGDYLTIGGTSGGPVTGGGQVGEVNVVDGPVNFRSGPSTDDAVISVIPDGGLVALTGDSANGFSGIIYTDRSGWADTASIVGGGEPVAAPVAPPATVEVPASVPVGDTVSGSATVFDGALNLRAGPGTTYSVITVMPGAAAVELRGAAQANFLPLSYAGTTGWASADFLAVAAPAPPAAPVEAPAVPAVPAPPVTAPVQTDAPAAPRNGEGSSDIVSIIYAAADAYGQSREDMLRVATCESNLVPTAINASSQASGLFQFIPSTFASTPYAGQDIFDPVASANAAGWMWANGRRNEWECQ